MNTMSNAMKMNMRCREVASRPNPVIHIFDWIKAKEILESKGYPDASCGLKEDWFSTGAIICASGKMIPENECNAYLESLWATPVIIIDDTGEVIECYKDIPWKNPIA